MPDDSFAQLQLPRRPYLSPESIRDAFHQFAAAHHPDKAGGESVEFVRLTAAFEVLRYPVARLKHLIDLEGLAVSGAGQPGVPADLADLFPAVAQVRQQIALALEKKKAAQNMLTRSLAAADIKGAQDSAVKLTEKLDNLYADAVENLRRLDAAWPAPECRAALPVLHARFAFLTKWRDQLRESLLQLQLA